jgi:hypothetical protein
MHSVFCSSSSLALMETKSEETKVAVDNSSKQKVVIAISSIYDYTAYCYYYMTEQLIVVSTAQSYILLIATTSYYLCLLLLSTVTYCRNRGKQ